MKKLNVAALLLLICLCISCANKVNIVEPPFGFFPADRPSPVMHDNMLLADNLIMAMDEYYTAQKYSNDRDLVMSWRRAIWSARLYTKKEYLDGIYNSKEKYFDSLESIIFPKYNHRGRLGYLAKTAGTTSKKWEWYNVTIDSSDSGEWLGSDSSDFSIDSLKHVGLLIDCCLIH